MRAILVGLIFLIGLPATAQSQARNLTLLELVTASIKKYENAYGFSGSIVNEIKQFCTNDISKCDVSLDDFRKIYSLAYGISGSYNDIFAQLAQHIALAQFTRIQRQPHVDHWGLYAELRQFRNLFWRSYQTYSHRDINTVIAAYDVVLSKFVEAIEKRELRNFAVKQIKHLHSKKEISDEELNVLKGILVTEERINFYPEQLRVLSAKNLEQQFQNPRATFASLLSEFVVFSSSTQTHPRKLADIYIGCVRALAQIEATDPFLRREHLAILEELYTRGNLAASPATARWRQEVENAHIEAQVLKGRSEWELSFIGGENSTRPALRPRIRFAEALREETLDSIRGLQKRHPEFLRLPPEKYLELATQTVVLDSWKPNYMERKVERWLTHFSYYSSDPDGYVMEILDRGRLSNGLADEEFENYFERESHPLQFSSSNAGQIMARAKNNSLSPAALMWLTESPGGRIWANGRDKKAAVFQLPIESLAPGLVVVADLSHVYFESDLEEFVGIVFRNGRYWGAIHFDEDD